MNRQQAEHILDAFLEMHSAYKTSNRKSVSVDKAYEAMREVILDEMTSCQVTTAPNITWPTTQPSTIPIYKPIVTCESSDGVKVVDE